MSDTVMNELISLSADTVLNLQLVVKTPALMYWIETKEFIMSFGHDPTENP